MKLTCIILLCLPLAAWSQTDPGLDPSLRRIDSLTKQVLNILIHIKEAPTDSLQGLADEILRSSRQAHYSHGIAIALAFQAFYMDKQENNFLRGEQLARQSLDEFGHTADKEGITVALYALGFSVFAQSRYDEAIRYYQQAREYSQRSGNKQGEVFMLSMIGEAYRERGDYAKAFDIQRECTQLAEAIHNPEMIKAEYLRLAELYVEIEDYASAETYYRQAWSQGGLEDINTWSRMTYAELLTRRHQYDSALYLYNRFDSAHATSAMLRIFLVSKGEYYLVREDYTKALPYFLNSLAYQRRLNDRNQIMRCLHDLAKTYASLGQDAVSFRYAREELNLATTVDARQNIRDGCQVLYSLYEREGQVDSAYFYYRRYITLKDSVLNDQLKGKFASYGAEQQVRLLSEEKQLQEVCLRQEMMEKNLLIMGILALFIFGAIYVWIVRLNRRNEAHRRKQAEDQLEIQRLEGERAKAALQERTKELEIQALRSQMNPHFIFNCLNAINRFVLGHETEAASDYLTKFSRLMRMIMNHSRHPLIPLADELEVLRLYLDMESLRFRNAFDYSIHLEEDMEPEEILIPPLLLQPFVENAIWHGLMHKEGRGELFLRLEQKKDLLIVTIRDNGIGRKKAGLLKSKSVEKYKSMGLQITAQRLALLKDKEQPGHLFEIEDLYDQEGNAAGTQVVLKIRSAS